MNKNNISRFVSFLIIVITIISANKWSSFRFVFNDYSSVFPVYFLTLFLVVYKLKYYNNYDSKKLRILLVYLIWVVISFIRGIFVAENRAEYISLINHTFALLLPLIVFSASNPVFVQRIFTSWFKSIIPIYLIFIFFFLDFKNGGVLLYPFTILLIGFSVLPLKWKWISLVVVILMDLNLDNRILVLKYGIAFLIGLLFYKKNLFTKIIINVLSKFFMMLPIFMLILGMNGIFNVFETNKYISTEFKVEATNNGKRQEVSLIEDSRTFLYLEVISSAINNDYVFFGRTPARGNDTQVFSYISDNKYSSGKAERPENEAAILNTFTWTGIVGVILYFFVFLIASNLAINESKNYFIKLIGLFVSFRWLYAWIEDIQKFDIMNITLWIMISMCFSYSFRNMTDEQFKFWINGIFNSIKVKNNTTNSINN